jgi:hypothetical protein
MTKCTALSFTYASRMTVAATAILTPEAYCIRVQARLEGEDTISRVVFSINRGSSGYVNCLMIELDKQHNIAPKYKLVQQLVEDESTACHVDVDFEKIDNFSKNIIKDMRIFDEDTVGATTSFPASEVVASTGCTEYKHWEGFILVVFLKCPSVNGAPRPPLALIEYATLNAGTVVAESTTSDSEAIVIWSKKDEADREHIASLKASAVENEKAIAGEHKNNLNWQNERAKAAGLCQVSLDECNTARQELKAAEKERKSLQAQLAAIKSEVLSLQDEIDFGKDCLDDMKRNPSAHKRSKF